MRLLPTTAHLLAVIVVGSGCGSSPTSPPEILLYNGKIFTAALDQPPWAEAMLIQGDRIIRVGSTSELRSAATGTTRSVDLGGRVVVPGFNDAHDHINPARPGIEFATGQSPTPDPSFAQVASLLTLVGGRPVHDPDGWLAPR